MKSMRVRIGMDTAKSVFQLHGVDTDEVAVLRRQLRRSEMIRYFEKLPDDPRRDRVLLRRLDWRLIREGVVTSRSAGSAASN